MVLMLKKFKASSFYQLFFVKAIKDDKQATIFSYGIAMIILVSIYSDVPRMYEHYPEPSHDLFKQVELIHITNNSRGSHPRLTILRQGNKATLRATVFERDVKKIKTLTPIEATIVTENRYTSWPFSEERILHLDIQNHKYLDYVNIYENSSKNKPSVEFVVIRLFMILILLLNVFLKHK